jgi:predicted DNA-binding protein
MGFEKYLNEKLICSVINVRLSVKEYEKIKALAKKHQTTITQIVRALIRQEIAEKESKNDN